MTLNLGLSGAHNRSEKQQQEIRQARKLLKEKVRNDWDYPALPAWQSIHSPRRKDSNKSDAPATVAGFRFHTSAQNNGDGGSDIGDLGFTPTAWREREESSGSDSETANVSSPKSARSPKKEFRFEGPDSVGTQISEQRLARRRKRQKRIVDEMSWNDGLAHWTRRRDLWCSAHTRAQIQELESRREAKETEEQEASKTTTPSATEGSQSAQSSPRTSTSSASAVISSTATTPDPSSATSSGPLNSHPTNPTSHPIPSPDLLIPVAPPILADHPIRRRMTSEMYGQIYTKVILQARTPSIPINLQTLVNAMVKGWKDDGEWPPKPAAPEPSLSRKKVDVGGGFKNGVKAVGRALRLTSAGPDLPT